MPTKDLLLSQAVEGFLMARRADGYSPKTIEQYKWALDMLTKYVDKPLRQVDIDDLRGFLSSVQENPRLSRTSAFHVWKAIRAFYKWTSSEGLSDRPDKSLTKPRFAYREIQPLTEEEIKSILKAIDRTKPSEGRRNPFTMPRSTAHRDRAIVMLLLDTGIRASELCRLNVEDVDLQNATITIRPHLSGIKSRPRIIPIGNVTRKALWRYLSVRDTEYRGDELFFSREGHPLNPNSLRYCFALANVPVYPMFIHIDSDTHSPFSICAMAAMSSPSSASSATPHSVWYSIICPWQIRMPNLPTAAPARWTTGSYRQPVTSYSGNSKTIFR